MIENTGKYRLLIAEDDVSLRHIVSAFFIKNGFDVDEAADGIEACGLVMHNRYDVIILDIMMPGKDGIEVCKFIRTRYDVPVIFLTASADEMSVVKGLDMGADDYIAKPFNPMELKIRVKKIIP